MGLVNDVYSCFHCTSIGASHIRKGTVCQDHSASLETDRYVLTVVSDGHGGADYFRSDRGSRFAAEAFCSCVADALDLPEEAPEPAHGFLQNRARNFADALLACRTEKQTEEQMRWFIRSLVTRWNMLIDADLEADPFREEDLAGVSEKAKLRYLAGERVQAAYGATLIGAVVTEDFWFGVQIGDGKCVAFDHAGTDTEPIPWDEQCFLNLTTSLCDSDAVGEFRFRFSRELPAAVFVGSDGIDGSFKNQRHLHNFYRVVLTSFAQEDAQQAAEELEAYLPQLSAQGSADDVSVGCILNLGHIRANDGLYAKRKEPYLKIFRVGNLGAEHASDVYAQTGEIEASEGIVGLDVLGCDGFRQGVMEFQILSVTENGALVSVGGTEYAVTSLERAEIQESRTVDGACQYDTLILQCVLK